MQTHWTRASPSIENKSIPTSLPKFHDSYLSSTISNQKMPNLRSYYRRFRIILLKHDLPGKALFLYSANILLALCLLYQLSVDRPRSSVSSAIRSLSLFSIEAYHDDVATAMRAFDFMHKQRVAAKPIPPPEEDYELPIVQKRCDPWWWQRDSPPLNASIRWNNELWQSISPSKTEIYLYSAFYDDRSNSIFPQAQRGFVQVLGMVWRRLEEDVYCQLRIDGRSDLIVVKALAREIWQKAWDPRDRFYVPVLFTCPLPMSDGIELVPAHVSLVTSDLCAQHRSPSTLLEVRTHTKRTRRHTNDGKNDSPRKRHTAVCVKGMDFLDDLSARFVEWLELNYHVGADKVVIYTYSVHPRVARVIEHYSRQGRLEHIPLTLPGHAPNAPLTRSRFIKRNRQQKRRHELIPYNDCLYRHLGTYEYVLIVDVDELVVPLEHANWRDMLDEVKRRGAAAQTDEEEHRGEDDDWTAFSIANAFFFDNLTAIRRQNENNDDDIPSYMHILKHDTRSRKISPPGVYGKSFMDTRNVATVFNHFPLHKQRRNRRSKPRPTFYVDANLARKNHYKAVCPIESRDECPDLYARTIADDSAVRYAARVAPKIKDVLKRLGIEP